MVRSTSIGRRAFALKIRENGGSTMGFCVVVR